MDAPLQWCPQLPGWFFIFGPPGLELASTVRSRIEAIFSRASVPIAHKKTERPSTTLTFLWYRNRYRLVPIKAPKGKGWQAARLTLAQWCWRRSCTKRDLQSISDHLSHTAIVIRPDHIFYTIFLQPCPACHNPVTLNAWIWKWGQT